MALIDQVTRQPLFALVTRVSNNLPSEYLPNTVPSRRVMAASDLRLYFPAIFWI
ncbi:MAG: hypothetical protein ACKV2Q_13620 [Planctomycetaceae bacterium]